LDGAKPAIPPTGSLESKPATFAGVPAPTVEGSDSGGCAGNDGDSKPAIPPTGSDVVLDPAESSKPAISPPGSEAAESSRSELRRVNVDTTVQEKAIAFPTDARLYHKARCVLVREAQRVGIELRQSYRRVGKRALQKQGRYAHAQQLKRARRETRKLRTYLGRVIRDLQRKAASSGRELDQQLSQYLERATASMNSSEQTSTSFTACRHRKWNASRKGKSTRSTSSVARCR
jgi:hypothetical protein